MFADSLLMDVVDDRIDAYEEKWLGEHKVSELCWEFERNLTGFVELFHLVTQINRKWRDQVFSGAIEFTTDFESRVKELFSKWLSSDDDVQELLVFFENQNYKDGVEAASAYRECVNAGRRIVSDWKSPRISSAIGLRDVKLNKEQSRSLRAFLAAPLPAAPQP